MRGYYGKEQTTEEILKQALESMAEQYIYDDKRGGDGHLHMSAGQEATWALSTLYPNEWIDTGFGVRRNDGYNPMLKEGKG